MKIILDSSLIKEGDIITLNDHSIAEVICKDCKGQSNYLVEIEDGSVTYISIDDILLCIEAQTDAEMCDLINTFFKEGDILVDDEDFEGVDEGKVITRRLPFVIFEFDSATKLGRRLYNNYEIRFKRYYSNGYINLGDCYFISNIDTLRLATPEEIKLLENGSQK